MQPNKKSLQLNIVNCLEGRFLPILLSFIWLLICQFAFYLIQQNEGINLEKALQAQFRNDLYSSNYEYLSRSVGDLETIGVIRCPKVDQIEPTKKTLIDLSFRGQCIKYPSMLGGGYFEVFATATNGDKFRLRFSTKNQAGFLFGLWSMRIGGLVLLWFIYSRQKMKHQQEQELLALNLASAQSLANLASQVSHDIRSPISALNMVINNTNYMLDEHKVLIQSSIKRINDIANSLLQQTKRSSKDNSPITKTEKNKSEPISVASILEPLIREKQVQYRNLENVHIHCDLERAKELFIRINGSDLSRIVSNLINNSVEAMTDNGSIVVSIWSHHGEAIIEIADNGKGIPKDILAKIGTRGFSYGKSQTDSGNGLGVYHAKYVVESYGGRFEIESNFGVGTIVTMTFPIAPLEHYL